MTADPTVALVGGGPGDPDLLTLDAEAALLGAREVVADRSLARLLDALAAEQPVGRGLAVLVDDDVAATEELLRAVGRGPGVVRLYRGDPWAHPAGDAERAALREHGLSWTTVPGVLAESAALAAVGIPAQVRDLAVTTTFTVDEALLAPREPAGVGLELPADPAHALVVRTADLVATAARLATPASLHSSTGDRPVALVPADGGAALRTTIADLPGLVNDRPGTGAAVPVGAGVVVVGLVAALDLRGTTTAPTTTAASAGAGR